MAVLLFKLFTLLMRTLARPLINWVSYYNRARLQSSNSKFHIFIKNKLINIGQDINFYNITINRKLFKLSTKDVIKPLSVEKALEKGAEFISEVIVYTILLSLPIYELVKLSKASTEKESIKENSLIVMRNDVNILVLENESTVKELGEIKILVSQVLDQLKINKFNKL